MVGIKEIQQHLHLRDIAAFSVWSVNRICIKKLASIKMLRLLPSQFKHLK